MVELIRHRPLLSPRLRDRNDWLSEALLDDFFGKGFLGAADESRWPPVDVYHDTATFFVRVELPGVVWEDIGVRLEGPNLIIEGERKALEGFNYHQLESPVGKFHRLVHLPDTLDTEKIDAKLHDGILTVSFPIKEGVKPKLIPVKHDE